MPSNCPAIAQGYTKGCSDSQGGTKKFWVTEWANIATLTESSGVITAFTLNPGKVLWLYEQELETAIVTEVPTPNRQNGNIFYEQNVTIVMNKQDASKAYGLRALGHQDLLIIAQHETGTNFAYGVSRGMHMNTGGEITTGTAIGDRNGYTILFNGKEPYPAFTISQALVDAAD